jgi:hypothetical protein
MRSLALSISLCAFASHALALLWARAAASSSPGLPKQV